MIRTALLLCVAAACGKHASEPATDKSADLKTADPACATKLAALEPWLAQLELETASYEIDFGPKLPVLDRTPMPVPHHVDNVEITKTTIEAYDVSEHDHAASTLGEHPKQQAVVDKLAKMKALAAGADEFAAAPDDLLRIDVDRDATWGDVVRVIDAATKAGYAHAVFAFGATSKLEQPPGVDATTTTQAAADAADKQLDALHAKCRTWPRGLNHKRRPTPSDDAAALAAESVAGLAECKCAADPDEVRAVLWKNARWHQAHPRVGVTIALNGSTELSLPANTPWSEAHAKLVAAPPTVKLAAK